MPFVFVSRNFTFSQNFRKWMVKKHRMSFSYFFTILMAFIEFFIVKAPSTLPDSRNADIKN